MGPEFYNTPKFTEAMLTELQLETLEIAVYSLPVLGGDRLKAIEFMLEARLEMTNLPGWIDLNKEES